MDPAAEESEEGSAALFNKRLNKILNKARVQDGTFVLSDTTNDLKR